MNTSTYYNLKLVEGTDIVNPLTTDVPNYETIDEIMHNNAITGVTLATEVANGTTHALIRENNECAVIRFIATSNRTLGDTITVDGIPVVALLPSGEVLPNGAYVINANVLCILTGTNLTIYAERKKAENANEIAYNDTTVGEELAMLSTEINTLNESLEESRITYDVNVLLLTVKSTDTTIDYNLGNISEYKKLKFVLNPSNAYPVIVTVDVEDIYKSRITNSTYYQNSLSFWYSTEFHSACSFTIGITSMDIATFGFTLANSVGNNFNFYVYGVK